MECVLELEGEGSNMIFEGIAPTYYRKISGKYTFIGVAEVCGRVDELYLEMTRNWNAESTLINYKHDIENRLVKVLPIKPMCEYTMADFRDSMEKLKLKYGYDDMTVAHYRLLFLRIYEA